MQQIIEYLQNLNKTQNQYVDNSMSQVLNQQQSESSQQQPYKEITSKKHNSQRHQIKKHFGEINWQNK